MSINVIKENKFKNITISVRFRSPLMVETMATKMILSDLLSNVCSKYPTKQAVTRKLNELYGASLNSNYITYGKSQVVELRAKIIHPSYIHNEVDLLSEILSLINEFITNPKYDKNGLIDNDLLSESKRMTLSKITRIIDEPSQYSSVAASAAIGEGFPLGIQAYKQKDQIQAVSQQELTSALKALLDDTVDVIVIGDVDEKQTKETIANYFPTAVEDSTLESSYLFEATNFDLTKQESRDITQTYITMVYQTNVSNKSDDYWKLAVANAVFGQTASSLLFREVREKHSLCYSIYSNLSAYDGVMMVHVGVDPINVDKTIHLINEQFNRVCNKDFPLETIATIKEMLANSLINQLDDTHGILNFAYRDLLVNKQHQVNDIIKIIQAVTVDEIQAMFKNCKLVLTYQLGKEA